MSTDRVPENEDRFALEKLDVPLAFTPGNGPMGVEAPFVEREDDWEPGMEREELEKFANELELT